MELGNILIQGMVMVAGCSTLEPVDLITVLMPDIPPNESSRFPSIGATETRMVPSRPSSCSIDETTGHFCVPHMEKNQLKAKFSWI